MANSRKAACVVDAQGLLKHLQHFLENHLPPKADITLALSGGLDSCVLLHLLAELRQSLHFQLSAIHVNHQISPNAGEWAYFCQKLCADLSVPLQVVEVNVPRDSGLGLEAAAREARYHALLTYCNGALVLAHHLDDQAETVLLQMLRGAGVAGLAAMPPVAELNGVKLLRPLLDVSRASLESHARKTGLQWIEDESNLDSRFDRNFLRNEVFPLLVRRFPAYATTLARGALNFADSAAILEETARQDAAGYCAPGRLDTTALKALPLTRAANLLRWWLHRESGQIPSRARLYEILEQVLHARADAQVACALDDTTLRRYRQWAILDRGPAATPYCVAWHGGETLPLPDGNRLIMKKHAGTGISPEAIKNGLLVTNRAGKPQRGKLEIKLHPQGKTRTLKNLWQEAGIPPWARERMPLVWVGERLAAVPGIGIAAEFTADASEAGATPQWIKYKQ